MINICGPRDKRRPDAINTTSTSKNWSRGLSPFFLGPIEACAGLIAQNVENGYQFSKCYQQHVGPDGLPNAAYFKWAKEGWADTKAHRYPMGKGAKPEFSYWNGKKLTYIEARKEIYIPMYAKAVVKTEAYQKLKELNEQGDIWLWDFDGYDHRSLNMNWDDVINSETRKMGHAFVLGMLLEGYLV